MRRLLLAPVPGYLAKPYETLSKLVRTLLSDLKVRFLAKMPGQAGKRYKEKRLIHIRTLYGTIAYPEDTLSTIKEIYEREVYICVRPLKHDDVVIDVGAHVGAFTLKATKEAENDLIVTVELHP